MLKAIMITDHFDRNEGTYILNTYKLRQNYLLLEECIDLCGTEAERAVSAKQHSNWFLAS